MIKPGVYVFRHHEMQLLCALHVVKDACDAALRLLAPLRLGAGHANLTAPFEEMHWTTAVVRYSRPFMGGRLLWDPLMLLSKLNAAERAAHERIRDSWRNKHIAHSVGEFENPVPVIQVGETDGSFELWGAYCNTSLVVSAGSDDVEAFHSIAGRVREIAMDLIATEESRVIKALSTVPVEELVAQGEYALPKLGDLAKPRN